MGLVIKKQISFNCCGYIGKGGLVFSFFFFFLRDALKVSGCVMYANICAAMYGKILR